MGAGDGARGAGGQRVDDGAEDVAGPGLVADDAALEGVDADVEEAVLVLGGEAVVLAAGGRGGFLEALGLGEEDADDGLEDGGVDVEGDVDEGEGPFLRGISEDGCREVEAGSWSPVCITLPLA